MEAKNIIEKKSYRWALIVGLSLLVVFGSLNLFVVDKTPADKGPSLSLSIPAILATFLLVPVIEELSYRLWCIRKNVAWNTLIIVLTLAISPHAESHQVETDYFKMTLEPNLWDRKASGGLGTDDTCTTNWDLPALTASLLSQHMWDSSSYAMNTLYKSDGSVLNPVYTITLIAKKSGQSVFNKTEVDNNHPPAPSPSTPHNFPPASTSSPSPPSNPLPPTNCCCNNPNRKTPVSNNTNLTNGTTTPLPIRATCGRNHLLKATLHPGHKPRAHSMYRTGGRPARPAFAHSTPTLSHSHPTYSRHSRRTPLQRAQAWWATSGLAPFRDWPHRRCATTIIRHRSDKDTTGLTKKYYNADKQHLLKTHFQVTHAKTRPCATVQGRGGIC